jgi:hypothetical protein
MATVASFFEPHGERPPTRLSVNVENAREIRAALAKPMPPREPLPPITAKLAYGQLKHGRAVAMNTSAQKITRAPKLPKVPKAGLNAMASAETKSSPQALNVELHRVY